MTVQTESTCKWCYDETHYIYTTQCGTAFIFDGMINLNEHNYKFCPKCGKRITEDSR